MNPFGITPKSYQLILDTFPNYPEIDEVIIFGSRAKGTYRNGSDIDLAIKGALCNERTAMNLSGILNEALPIPYHIDVICYNNLTNEALIEHINRIGVLFYEKKEISILNEPTEKYNKKGEEENKDTLS